MQSTTHEYRAEADQLPSHCLEIKEVYHLTEDKSVLDVTMVTPHAG